MLINDLSAPSFWDLNIELIDPESKKEKIKKKYYLDNNYYGICLTHVTDWEYDKLKLWAKSKINVEIEKLYTFLNLDYGLEYIETTTNIFVPSNTLKEELENLILSFPKKKHTFIVRNDYEGVCSFLKYKRGNYGLFYANSDNWLVQFLENDKDLFLFKLSFDFREIVFENGEEAIWI